MTEHDRVPHGSTMVEWALRWSPYGGVPADEVFVVFGIGEREFYRRLAAVVAADDAAATMEPDVRVQLNKLCEHWLVQLSTESG
nr:hypothetical protein [Gordonia sp. LAM0048]